MERKSAETEKVRVINELKRVNKAKDMFLARISHEIRTPLNGVKGVINLISETKLNSEQLELVELADISCKNLLLLSQ